MPIASGAAGRVHVGVGAGTTWTEDGQKRTNAPSTRDCNSYLQRYYQLKERKKIKRHAFHENPEPSDNENDAEETDSETNNEAKEENFQKNSSREEETTSGTLPSEVRSKKSPLCVLL
ncbi:hypothetical protein CesoFtcFv8_003535 [Champsocephalus esox]|uniref:Uncharacterized protein n=2 Tax=Champsocephalus TaxID=52236 RepID=A0AAN8HXQ6_CHAGU|nr:hypothetical protein CesoFtcFv8_003535 [Champsocephalus esox]KAK5932226.1 hypothetical protein CgunFtcFv8_003949 [Champsocephalus gunnari]